MNTGQKGEAAEIKACEHLMKNGCRILERNFYTPVGEIDIVAEKEGTVHFVEVKSGRTFEPVYNITPVKLERIVKSARFWLKKYDISLPWQIDAVIVKGDDIEWLENVTV